MKLNDVEKYLCNLGAEMQSTHSEADPFTIYKIRGANVSFYLYNDRLEIGMQGRHFYKGRLELGWLEDSVHLDLEILAWSEKRKKENIEDRKLFDNLESFVLGKFELEFGLQRGETHPNRVTLLR